MIDGVKIYYHINDFEAWKKSTGIELFTPTDLETGATKGKLRTFNGGLQQTIAHRGNFGTYKITVKETTITNLKGDRSVSFFLILDGSLHKNHFGGSNYLPFTWDYLQKEINSIETGLQLSGRFTELVNIEIGLNISVSFPVFSFLTQNLIAYKGNPFNRYKPDKDGACLGYVCHLRQYSVKIYDKGTQYNLPENVMRFELRYLKMQPLKDRSIKTLADLRDQQKVNSLLDLLLTAWDNILLFDNTISLINPEMKQKDRELLNNGRRSGYWEELKEKNKRNFNYQRAKFRELVTKYGKGWHEKIKELIIAEWETLFKNCTILPTAQNPGLNEFTVKINCKNGQNGHSKEGDEFSYTEKRVCLSCGRDITNQDGRSKFCGAKYVGETAAHQCRNRASNPRNNLKNKIERLNRMGVLFDIKPYLIVNNNKKQPYAI